MTLDYRGVLTCHPLNKSALITFLGGSMQGKKGLGGGDNILLLINSSLIPANFADSWFRSSSTTMESSAVALSVVSYVAKKFG